jgi:hypothetical protein
MLDVPDHREGKITVLEFLVCVPTTDLIHHYYNSAIIIIMDQI